MILSGGFSYYLKLLVAGCLLLVMGCFLLTTEFHGVKNGGTRSEKLTFQ